MRDITQEAIGALLNGYNFSKSNTQVICYDDGERDLKLHGNTIIRKTSEGWMISNCGWETPTTKERLNHFLDMMSAPLIFQKDFVWYIGTTDQPMQSGWTKLCDIK